jgi:hypothetical protein
VIVHVKATPTRISMVDATEIMVERIQDRFDLKSGWIAADVTYGTGS